jgi:hypothetical protein
MLRNWLTTISTVAMLAGAYAVATSPGKDEDALVLTGGHGGYGPVRFVLEGRPVHGLYPGVTKQISLKVSNPLGYKLRLTEVTGKVTSTSRRGCPATTSNLQVKKYTGVLPLTIRPHDRLSLAGTIPIVMPSGASRNCAGSHFTIALSGLAYRVDR